jgi:hypothetical protein
VFGIVHKGIDFAIETNDDGEDDNVLVKNKNKTRSKLEITNQKQS